MTGSEPFFFAKAAEFREWLAQHHGVAQEVWVGFRKRGSKLPSLTWPESVDQALCFGWIDGLRKSIDHTSYKIRFTPRKPDSKWSGVNLRRIEQLAEEGLMHRAGLEAHARRSQAEHGSHYSYEQRHAIQLDPDGERLFRQQRSAWKFFEAQPPWYRKTALWWVMSAKRDSTRERRLQQLIADSEQGRFIEQLRSAEPKTVREKRDRSDTK